MIPRILISKAATPDGGKEICLYKHDEDYSITVGNAELMSSRAHGSEEALAELACKRIENQEKPRVLIGGLGMGFTLRAALDRLPVKAQVVVAELVPAVVRWNRGPLAGLAGRPLSDKRVSIREADAAEMIQAGPARYNAIMLDVDNGPGAVTRTDNDWFYSLKGLYAIFAALRPKGVLATWSAGPDAAFTARMNKVGFTVDEVRVRAHSSGKGGHHIIWIARKTGSKSKKKINLCRRQNGS
ncbi:MAG: spermidine synthase [Candidatus Omnitrophota bacterium]|nr:spermidine synthase [Candidatus Omnitrophota bacterium]